ncbi:unnamed protein product [Ambrosiozyma monospora]|uniref:Unnamed protein product n=1 Tax=Ambrosiozyma monospora TaxID=43982 RepID=A0A9W7DBU5_AMBMO|nr:unnamed protein product [Ambrosiozyma monospora]
MFHSNHSAPSVLPSLKTEVVFTPLLKLTKSEIKILRASWKFNASNKSKHRDVIMANDKSISANGTNSNNRKYNKKNSREAGQTGASVFGSNYFWIEVYEDLIHRNPEIQHFLPSIKHQTVQFASIMLTAVENLENLSNLQLFLQRLGRMHMRVFNVKNDYFQQMGESLLAVLMKRVPDLPTVQLWMRLYCFLANSMMNAVADDFTLSENSVRSSNPTIYVSEEYERRHSSISAQEIEQSSHLAQQDNERDSQETIAEEDEDETGNGHGKRSANNEQQDILFNLDPRIAHTTQIKKKRSSVLEMTLPKYSRSPSTNQLNRIRSNRSTSAASIASESSGVDPLDRESTFNENDIISMESSNNYSRSRENLVGRRSRNGSTNPNGSVSRQGSIPYISDVPHAQSAEILHSNDIEEEKDKKDDVGSIDEDEDDIGDDSQTLTSNGDADSDTSSVFQAAAKRRTLNPLASTVMKSRSRDYVAGATGVGLGKQKTSGGGLGFKMFHRFRSGGDS